MLTRLLGGCLTASLLAGCNDPPEGPSDPPTFTLSHDTQWSGGEVRVSSSHFSGGGALPPILGGSASLAATRIDDTTIAVTLAEGSTSLVKIYVQDGGTNREAGEVHVLGFRSRQEAPGMFGELYPVRNHLNQAGYLGAEWVASGPAALAFLPIGTLLLATFPGFAYPGGTYGVGIAPNGQHFIVRDTAGLINEWKLFPTPSFIASVPPSSGSPRQIARLSDSVWLFTGSHTVYSRKLDFSFPYSGQAESPSAIYLSPRGDRALTTSNGYAGLPGIPVFDTQSGDTAYVIPVSIPGQLPSNESAVFSSGGDYLTVLSGPYLAPNLLIRVDAETGVVLAVDSLPAGVVGVALAMDGTGQNLLAYAIRNTYPVLYVLNAATLAHTGTLPVPAVTENECNPATDGRCWSSAIIVDNATLGAYVAVPGDVTRVYAFDLVP